MRLKITYLAALTLLLASCVKQEFEPRTEPLAGERVRLTASIEQPIQTLVSTDHPGYTTSFEDGDRIGVYAVVRKSGETKPLTASGNYADNVEFTFDGTEWSGRMRYPRGDSVLDIYAYYPYRASIADATAIAFGVQADQSVVAGYNAGELLSDSVTAAGAAVALKFEHRMAMVELTIEDAAEAPTAVMLLGLMPGESFNLLTSAVAAGATPAPIAMLSVDDNDPDLLTYRALVPAQEVAAGNLFEVKFAGGDSTVGPDALTPLTAGSVTRFSYVIPAAPAPVEP